MRRSNTLLGLIGLILITFALIAGAVTGGATTVDVAYIVIHLGLGLMALIAYLTTGVKNLREFVGQRSTRYGLNALLYTAIFVAILVPLNFLSTRHHKRWDLSEQQVFSLSPQSAKIVAGLDKPLEMIAFVEGGINPQLEDLLRSYKEASPQASFRMVDPDRDPVLAEQKKITLMNSVWLGYGDQSTIVTQPTEESITNALIKVTRPNKTMVCFVEGHGEPDIGEMEDPRAFGQVKSALGNENYEVKKILLANFDKVPAE